MECQAGRWEQSEIGPVREMGGGKNDREKLVREIGESAGWGRSGKLGLGKMIGNSEIQK